MKTGFICASGFNLVGSAKRNGKRLIVVVLGSPSGPYRAVKAAGLLERGFQRGPLSWLAPSLGTVDKLQPVSAAPPDLRDEMCGKHRKRPAAEEADDDGESASFMLSNLPPGTGKASDLLKDKPDPYKAIVVFVGAAKTAAEKQFNNARAKIQKLAKGKNAKPDAKTEQAAAPQSTTGAPAPLQAASAPPAGAFTTPPSQPQRTLRALPAATDVSNPSAMSYTAPARAEPAPLTAMPGAKPETKPAAATASKPKPKPDTKQAAKPDTKPAKPAAKPAAAKSEKKPDAKPAAKPAAAKQAAAGKPANGAKPQ
jgi:D-alanyl-D-alanine carboxypeptidase